MISAGEIYDYIDSFAPFSSAMDFDNVGILIGSRDALSEKVLLALDITSEVISEAVQKNVSVIVTHHPIIFHPLKNIHTDSLQYKLIKNNMTVISAHTNLDICCGGVNDTLAEKIGLNFTEHTNNDCYLLGETDKEFSFTEFADYIKDRMNCKGFRFTYKNGSIKRVLVACGAGGSSIFDAVKEKADAFVTGEIKHHELLAARENNIAVYDLGHFRSEDMIIDKLAEMLKKRFPETDFEKAESDREGIYYLA